MRSRNGGAVCTPAPAASTVRGQLLTDEELAGIFLLCGVSADIPPRARAAAALQAQSA